jgi:CrcB protein
MPARRRRPLPRRESIRPSHRDLPVDPDLAPDDPSEPSPAHVHGTRVRRSRHPTVLLWITGGGMLGALARYEVELAWPTHGGFPWATFVINTSGALFLGVVLSMLLAHPAPPRALRPFLCVGFAGSWTTMSTVALESDLLVHGGRSVTALVYLLATVLVGVGSAWAGIAFGRRVSKGAQWLSRS